MSRSSLRRRLRQQITTTPATAMTPSATPATMPIESKLLFPLDFHSNAIPIKAAIAHSPAISFILGGFRYFSVFHHMTPTYNHNQFTCGSIGAPVSLP